jgi:hypothetical protein
MTNKELVERIGALPEKERIECVKSISKLCEVYEYIDSYIKQESVEERQKRLEVSEYDYEIRSRVSEEVMNQPFNI